ncbi:unnamed protein product [Porites evermanni]|uniref:Sulfatase N-terminal domain-containing protein n=1 Tax=Porites evermanni TaxID=104178 RepID=A0ABN8PJS3_9CNID|nr:unnamed protein product [Porites evermanni]
MNSRCFEVITFMLIMSVRPAVATPLHILLIVVDDLGWSDVGFHNPQINTPNLDHLASEGVILDNYYVQPICTPTRAALLTGLYPIHTGMQKGVLHQKQPYGLPLRFTTLSQKLKEAGYSTHIIGKWHLGFFRWPYTPLYRGFDSFYGFYGGAQGYYSHEHDGILDLHDNKKPVRNKRGVYSATLYAEQARRVILSHNASKPLFLYLPFQSVHGPLSVDLKYEQKYRGIRNKRRRTYAGMVDILDEAIGNVTQAMKEAGLWNDTLTIVTTDNGGDPGQGGYNWPLRGQKGSLWEGGVRGVGLVHGRMLQKTGVKCKELLHVTDWYPTLVNLTGKLKNLRTDAAIRQLDGFNIWRSLSEGDPSPRREIVHDIGDHKAAIRVGDMKLILNQTDRKRYIPPELVGSIPAGQRKKGNCCKKFIDVGLYNITADPYEMENLRNKFPDIVEALMTRVEYYRQGVVPPEKKSSESKARKVARRKGHWGPWKD